MNYSTVFWIVYIVCCSVSLSIFVYDAIWRYQRGIDIKVEHVLALLTAFIPVVNMAITSLLLFFAFEKLLHKFFKFFDNISHITLIKGKRNDR
jgi:Na+/alanine symporter